MISQPIPKLKLDSRHSDIPEKEWHSQGEVTDTPRSNHGTSLQEPWLGRPLPCALGSLGSWARPVLVRQ